MSSRTNLSRLLALAVLIGFAGVMPGRALADIVAHATLAHFQQNIRADYIVEPFNGADNANVPAPLLVSGNGYSYSIAPSFGPQQLLRVASAGIGCVSDGAATQFTFTGKPVSAFAGTFRILSPGFVPVPGVITVQTNTGVSTTMMLNAGPGFFAYTSTEPFTTLTFQAGPGVFEMVDDFYVGTSASVATAADFCSDASTVGLGAYPFTTVGAVRYLNTSSCNTETISPDVYYRFMPAATGLATVDTCGCTFDSILRIFSSCGGPEIACNDDDCNTSTFGNTASRVYFRVTAGQPVIIRIAGYLNDSGSGTLTIAEHADCPADFNHSGGNEVQDIFDFLAAWFAGCP